MRQINNEHLDEMAKWQEKCYYIIIMQWKERRGKSSRFSLPLFAYALWWEGKSAGAHPWQNTAEKYQHTRAPIKAQDYPKNDIDEKVPYEDEQQKNQIKSQNEGNLVL